MVKGSILLVLFPLICVAIDDIIDTFEPVIRNSPEVIPTNPNDLFGYSLVLHKLVAGGNIDDTRIVVSAPHGQAVGATLSRLNNADPTNSATGVVYTCPIQPGPCEGLRGDGTGADNRLYDTEGNLVGSGGVSDSNTLEQKRGQFLGSTLKSTGDDFLVCAHRRLDYGGGFDRNPYGICYFSDRDLSGFNSYDPCLERRSRSFFGFGQCQAGTSGDIINGNFFLGAPGTYAWRGAVFRRSSAQRTTFSGNGVGSDSISWQGYEVITGRINSPNLDFIVSVPRFSNYRGRVNVYANNDGELRPVGNPPLAGDQVGAYYGFAMAAVDFSGSGMDDLLISAPMYSPTVDSPEYGRVYVYRNNGGALSLFTELDGTVRFGRFGHAMAKLGDINGDGLEDVAISAPFGNGEPGTVFIYVGANDENNELFRQTPVQTIRGNELNVMGGLSNLQSFGTSLSSGVDVDNNGYNDLGIGAYMSQQVFMLRTRPVAILAVELMPDPVLDDTEFSCQSFNRPCFNITVCMEYSGTGLQSNLLINYTLSVDAQSVQRGVPSRVMLINETSPTPRGTFNGTLNLMEETRGCVQTTAIFQDGVSDTTTPFAVQFQPRLAEVRQADPNWNGNSALNPLSIPVLSISGATSATTPFLILCANTTCVPDLQVDIMRNDIEFQNSDGVATDNTGIVAGVVAALDIPVRVTNAGEDAFGARLLANFSNVFNFVRAVPVGAENETSISLTCDSIRGTTTTRTSCVISDRFQPNATNTIVFRFQSNNVQGSEGEFIKIFEATSSNVERITTLADNIYNLDLDVFANADISVQAFFDPGAIVLGENNPMLTNESAVTELSSASQQIEGNFVIDNAGPTTIPSAMLTIFWPYDAMNGRYYLYPFQIEGATCEQDAINPRNLLEPRDINQIGNEGNSGNEDLTLGKRRRRRQARASSDTTISCIDTTFPACVKIVCNITGISTTVNPVVKITAYPDNRVFYQTQSVWNFTVYARVKILQEYIKEPAGGGASNETSASLEGAPFLQPDDDDGIPAWVIIVPIIIGILIIIVVVVVLYFLGFFKLKKVDKDQDELNQNEETPDGEKPESSEL